MVIDPSLVGGAVGLAVLWRVLAVVVYRNAAADGRERALAWTVAVLVFGAAGLAAYGLGDRLL